MGVAGGKKQTACRGRGKKQAVYRGRVNKQIMAYNGEGEELDGFHGEDEGRNKGEKLYIVTILLFLCIQRAW